MREIVINKCYGGFNLSMEAKKKYAKLNGVDVYFYKEDIHNKVTKVTSDKDDSAFIYALSVDLGSSPIRHEFDEACNEHFYHPDIQRDDKALVKVVKELGEKAGYRYSELKVVEIPEDVEWAIEEYDGMEWVAEKHRTWN